MRGIHFFLIYIVVVSICMVLRYNWANNLLNTKFGHDNKGGNNE